MANYNKWPLLSPLIIFLPSFPPLLLLFTSPFSEPSFPYSNTPSHCASFSHAPYLVIFLLSLSHSLSLNFSSSLSLSPFLFLSLSLSEPNMYLSICTHNNPLPSSVSVQTSHHTHMWTSASKIPKPYILVPNPKEPNLAQNILWKNGINGSCCEG